MEPPPFTGGLSFPEARRGSCCTGLRHFRFLRDSGRCTTKAAPSGYTAGPTPEGASATGRIRFCSCAAKTAAAGFIAEASSSCGVLGETAAATAAETSTASGFLCKAAASAGGPLRAGLYGCFPAGPVWLKCAAGSPPLTDGRMFLRCRLTLAAGLCLGRVMLDTLVMFLLTVGFVGLRLATAVAGTSSRLSRSTAESADSSASRRTKTFASPFEGPASRAFPYTDTLANARRRFPSQSQRTADTLCRPLCHHGHGGAEYSVGDHARESRAVAGDGRV